MRRSKGRTDQEKYERMKEPKKGPIRIKQRTQTMKLWKKKEEKERKRTFLFTFNILLFFIIMFYSPSFLIRGAFNKFPDAFVQAFKIAVMLLLYFLWDDWPIFMISSSKEQLQQQLEYTSLKPDCNSWWISKMQSGHEDTLEERYAIKFCFKLGKNDATETYGMLQTAFRPSCKNRASVFE